MKQTGPRVGVLSFEGDSDSGPKPGLRGLRLHTFDTQTQLLCDNSS